MVHEQNMLSCHLTAVILTRSCKALVRAYEPPENSTLWCAAPKTGPITR